MSFPAQYDSIRTRVLSPLFYKTHYSLKTQFQGQQREGDYPLRRSAGTPPPSAYIFFYLMGHTQPHE